MDKRDDETPGRVISFPQVASAPPEPPKTRSRTRAKNRMELTQPEMTHSRIYLGPLFFTCPSCSNVMKLSGEGMILRSIDAYCDNPGCGRLARIKNPCFSGSDGRPGSLKPE